jgi:hypothetical protein
LGLALSGAILQLSQTFFVVVAFGGFGTSRWLADWQDSGSPTRDGGEDQALIHCNV